MPVQIPDLDAASEDVVQTYLKWVGRLHVEAAGPSSRSMAEALECSHMTASRLLKAPTKNKAMAYKLIMWLARQAPDAKEQTAGWWRAYQEGVHRLLELVADPVASAPGSVEPPVPPRADTENDAVVYRHEVREGVIPLPPGTPQALGDYLRWLQHTRRLGGAPSFATMGEALGIRREAVRAMFLYYPPNEPLARHLISFLTDRVSPALGPAVLTEEGVRLLSLAKEERSQSDRDEDRQPSPSRTTESLLARVADRSEVAEGEDLTQRDTSFPPPGHYLGDELPDWVRGFPSRPADSETSRAKLPVSRGEIVPRSESQSRIVGDPWVSNPLDKRVQVSERAFITFANEEDFVAPARSLAEAVLGGPPTYIADYPVIERRSDVWGWEVGDMFVRLNERNLRPSISGDSDGRLSLATADWLFTHFPRFKRATFVLELANEKAEPDRFLTEFTQALDESLQLQYRAPRTLPVNFLCFLPSAQLDLIRLLDAGVREYEFIEDGGAEPHHAFGASLHRLADRYKPAGWAFRAYRITTG
ncbi:hypothetical protein [Actinacidiphila glaucinigra]|uniref:hypothetical protein n=1 Tax=Actinacidiphila glaucinigra TaxID=235986 RepID=UPI0036ECAEBC